MTARRPQPKVQRVIPTFMAVPKRQQRSDLWPDVAVISWAIAALLFCYLVATTLPR